MGSSNLWLPQFGVDAMNGYFTASGGGGMLSADVPPFHPSMPPPDHGGYGLGLCSGGATATAADISAQCTANNLMLASLASQLYASAAPHAQRPSHGDHLGARTPPEEEMDGGYDVRPGAATLACHGQSDARAMAPCSISSSDSMASSTDQFSPASAVTHMSRAVHSSEQSQQAYRPQPQPRFWPVHFAVVVARSPYAPVAQRALNDAVGHVLRGVADVDADSAVSGASSSSAASSRDQSMAPSLEEYSHGHGGARWGEAQRVRSELLSMLQLMDEKYYQCLEEIQSTTAKFSGLMQPSGSSSSSGGGSICAPFAHRAVLSAYRALRRRITGEIMAAAGAAGWPSHQPHRAESSMVSCVKMEQSSSWEESAFIQKHVAVRRRPPHQEWRPQRGLPEKSVSVLKTWLFENFLHPYPQDSEKDMLAATSGLTRNQVANWFINARVRLWKPLIVELHEELKRSSGGRDGPAPAMAPMSSQYVVG